MLLTVHEVALRMRVCSKTVHRWIESGRLRAIYLPHTSERRFARIHADDLADFIANLRTNAESSDSDD
jgi:excisionase family DNA binding protein